MKPDWPEITRIIRRHSATFYLGSLLLPGEARLGAWAVYAACRLGDEAVDGEGAGPKALAAWWAGVERAYRGEPREAWEVGLAWALERWPIPEEAFHHMRQGFETDLGPVDLKSEAELLRYCYRVGGTVGRMIAAVLGGEEGEREAIALGQALQLTNILRDVGEDLRRGRIYLPEELRARYGVSREGLLKGEPGPGYLGLMGHLEAQARALYQLGFKGLRKLRTGRAAIALAALQYQGILDRLKAQGYPNLKGRAHLKPWERLFLLPKAYALARGMG